MAQSTGGVQVVSHGLGKALFDLVEFLGQFFGERGLLPVGLFQLHVDLAQGRVDAFDALFSLFQSVEGEVQRAAVVHGQQEIAQGLGQELFQDIADGEEVTQRFGHLLGVDLHESVVHPVVGERLARGGLGLGHFVFVVREGQVLAAAVDVQRQGGVFLGHGRALQVPAGTALAPGGFPERLAGLGRLPQGEVERVLLFLARSDTRAGLELVDVPAGQLAVAIKGADLEIHVPGRGGVGVALVDEPLRQVDHLRDVLGALGLHGGALDVQLVHVHVELADELLGDFAGLFAHFARAFDDLVVDVREVADEVDVVPFVLEIAVEHVEDHAGAGVADVAEVVSRDAADVHVHVVVVGRGECFLVPFEGIVESHWVTPFLFH